MAGTMTMADVVADLKRSVHDASSAFSAPDDADYKRVLAVALVAMQEKRPRTLLGQVALTADEVRFPVSASDFAAYKTHVWGSLPMRPWDVGYPGSLPRITAVRDANAWALMFDPAPSLAHMAAYGATFRFWYYGAHVLGSDEFTCTLAPADRPLLLLRAQAELMRELSMRNVNKPTQMRDGFTGAPRNSTPAALYRELLAEWKEAK